MKVAFLVRGLGEYAQATAVASLLQTKGEEILFISSNPFLKEVITNDGFLIDLVADDDSVKNVISNLVANILFLCNSHTTARYELSRPPHIKLVCSLDSNWLFNNQIYHGSFSTYDWIDICYVLFPKRMYEKNLKENGGYFDIDPFFKSKIYTPGFLPVGIKVTENERQEMKKKLGIQHDQKLIICYFGTSYFLPQHFRDLSTSAYQVIYDLISNIYSEGLKPHIVNLSTESEIYLKKNKTKEYNEMIACADLFIMHHGYGTIPKLLHNQIPVINFTQMPEDKHIISYYELKPLIDAGAIEHFFFETYNKSILQIKIENLLQNPDEIKKMQNNQLRIFENGETNLINHLYQHYNRKNSDTLLK